MTTRKRRPPTARESDREWLACLRRNLSGIKDRIAEAKAKGVAARSVDCEALREARRAGVTT
jgi:hypothetical protein